MGLDTGLSTEISHDSRSELGLSVDNIFVEHTRVFQYGIQILDNPSRNIADAIVARNRPMDRYVGVYFAMPLWV